MDTHRVRRLSWQARAPAPAQAFALRALLREQGDAVQATLDHVLTTAQPAAGVRHLPRLALHLDAASVDDLRANLLPRLEAALRDALGGLDLPVAAGAAAGAAAGVLPPERQRAGTPGPAVEPAAFDAPALLRHYLATGALHWTLAGLAPEAAQRSLRLAALQALEAVLALPAPAPSPLPAEPALRVGALVRWLHLLPAAARRRWLQAVRGRAWPGEAWSEAWFDWVGAEVADRVDAQALTLAWALVPGPERASTAAALAAWADRRAGAAAPLPPALFAPLRAWLARQVLAEGSAQASSAPPASTLPAAAPAAQLQPAIGPAPALDPPAAGEAPSDAVVVPLAGLVLLHPYLPRLLAGCGVLDARGSRVADDQWPRACALLHALACGDAEAAEHALPFVKLLLGGAPDAPLDASLPPLAAADREEVEALLAAVREHWSALRGSGVDALRVSFLQRRGLLRRRDGAWLLNVHGEPFDMLLSLLPWGIGLVRLPWMEAPLFVEWPTP